MFKLWPRPRKHSCYSGRACQHAGAYPPQASLLMAVLHRSLLTECKACEDMRCSGASCSNQYCWHCKVPRGLACLLLMRSAFWAKSSFTTAIWLILGLQLPVTRLTAKIVILKGYGESASGSIAVSRGVKYQFPCLGGTEANKTNECEREQVHTEQLRVNCQGDHRILPAHSVMFTSADSTYQSCWCAWCCYAARHCID